MTSKNELGRWLEREMAERSWSQRHLAQEADISQAQISRIINSGNSYPGKDRFDNYNQAVIRSATAFFHGSIFFPE